MKLISVIIPVYNVELFIHNCLDSVIDQTYSNLQIILVNDGSTDRSGLICDEYAANDNRIKVIHKKNAGLSAARNSGLDFAKGEFITFLDSDDYIDKDMYETLIRDAVTYDCDISICGSRRVNIDGEILKDNNCKNIKVLNREDAFNELHKSMNSAVWNKMYTKEVISGLFFELGRIHGEDLYFNVEALVRCKKVVFNALSKHNYLKRDGSITASRATSRMFDEIVLREKIRIVIYTEFPDFKYVADRWCFMARMDIARKIMLSGSGSQYKTELNECKRYMNDNYKIVYKHLKYKESMEYILITYLFFLYPMLMNMYLKNKRK